MPDERQSAVEGLGWKMTRLSRCCSPRGLSDHLTLVACDDQPGRKPDQPHAARTAKRQRRVGPPSIGSMRMRGSTKHGYWAHRTGQSLIVAGDMSTSRESVSPRYLGPAAPASSLAISR